MSDRDGLRRRAEVLQRVADQLSAQLRVERWSNGELRKLLGEPVAARGYDEDRAAARRFLTFASVAVATAAAVALLASSPWHGRETLPPPNDGSVAAPFIGSSFGGTIIPFTVIGASDSPLPGADKSGPAVRAPRTSPFDPYAIEMIFGRPSSRVRLTPTVPLQRRGLAFDPDELFGSERERSEVDVP